MYQKEPLPPYLQKLIGIGYRILIGAALGFVCTIAILSARALLWGDVFGPIDADIWKVAFTGGALFGAIYYPLAWLTLLEGENQLNATIAVCMGTIVIGIIGVRIAGPATPAIAGSFGFWGTCAALYQRRKRDRNRVDFGSYFR